jgi:hypothetical protein
VAGGTRYPDVALRAVDLPEEAITVPRRATAVVEGAPLAMTPLTSTWSGADTDSVSLVSAMTAEVRRVARTADTSAISSSTSLSAASVLGQIRFSARVPWQRTPILSAKTT